MPTALLVNGAESREPMASGSLSTLLVESARAELSPSHAILTTAVRDGYDVLDERRKFKEADVVIFQVPVFWFSLPSSMKKYIDDVYAYGVFFGATEHYGRGGLLNGKAYLISTTWNAASSDFGSAATILGDHTPDEVLMSFHLTQQYVGLSPLASFVEYDVVQRPDVVGATSRFREHLRRHVIDVRESDLLGVQ
jgi:NADPH dehydrogenase (quinone)